ncbi:MAG: acetyl xylan esterase [Fluviicola sp.]|nr:acetyl xylan esterase [Fluviicola sp.]
MRVIGLVLIAAVVLVFTNSKLSELNSFSGDHAVITYVGRFDFSQPERPKVWNPGAYFQFRFKGSKCIVTLNDEMKFGSYHNYVSIVVDGKAPRRVRLDQQINELVVAEGLSDGEHDVLICKDTESNIGYIQLDNIQCEALLKQTKSSKKVIEFIGDSITCGNGSDTTEIACGEGQWYDQHNAYLAYGPVVARKFNFDYLLSSYSGIGMAHSCCNIGFEMPDIYDRINLDNHGKKWKNTEHVPDIVCITLGQNDGVLKEKTYLKAYVAFVNHLRELYPNAQIVCCSSPMAGDDLKAYHAEMIPKIVKHLERSGMEKVHAFLYAGQYRGGCGSHPTVDQHQQMADELAGFLESAVLQ